MKKKLFLATLMTALLACLFVIGINAAGFESSFTNDVTEIGTGPDWADLSDKNATAVLKKTDETYVRIPLYYIYQANGSTELRHEIQTSSGRTGFRYDWIGTQLGEEITHANLVALDIPEGIKKTSGLNSYTALQEVVFPLSAESFPKSEGHPTLKKVFAKQAIGADGTVKGITQVSDYAFKNAKALEYFKLELDYATFIGDCAFMNNAVKELRFEGPFTGIDGSLFGGCSKLETIYINNTSATRVKGSQIFSGNSMLKNVVLNGVELPDYTFQNASGLTDGGLTIVATNVGAVGQMAFKNMTNLSSATLTGVTSLGNGMFLNCTNLKTVDISGPITAVNGNVFSNCPNVESAVIRVVGNPFPDATSVGGITSIVSKTDYESNKNAYATGRHLIYGYNVCEILHGGVHLTAVDEYEFTLFTEKSYVNSTCPRCQTVIATKEIAPLFVNLGFSAAEYGDMMSVNYRVNEEAVSDYEEATGETVNYGMFAVLADVIKTDDIFDENGDEKAGVVAADITDCGYTLFSLKMTGFSEEQKKTSFAMGAYIGTSKDEVTKYSYLQIAAPAEGEKYYFASYNDVVKLTPSDDETN